MLIKRYRKTYLQFPQTRDTFENYKSSASKPRYKISRKGRGLTANDSTSSSSSATSPGSSDLSLNESDIPLILLKPRKGQDVNQLPPASSYNTRSKTTTWYRPNPTYEDFMDSAGPSSSPKKSQTTGQANRQVLKPDPTVYKKVNPGKFYESSSSSSNSSISTHGSESTLFDRTKLSTSGPQKTNTRIQPNVGVHMTAGEPYQNIFEGQIGAAAGDPDNPLVQTFHNAFYKKLIYYDDDRREQLHRYFLERLNDQSQELRNKYELTNSWYEREQIRATLNQLFTRYRNNPDFPLNELHEITLWRQAIDQRISLFTQRMDDVDRALQREIDNENNTYQQRFESGNIGIYKIVLSIDNSHLCSVYRFVHM